MLANVYWPTLQWFGKFALEHKRLSPFPVMAIVFFLNHSETSDENESLFEAIVVLEEFCKELAAITFVKYHHATE